MPPWFMPIVCLCLVTNILPRGAKLDTESATLPWYSNKVETAKYLEEINREKKVRSCFLEMVYNKLALTESFKVLEYSRFQVGLWLDFVAHPYNPMPHIITTPAIINIEKRNAILVAGYLDVPVTFTYTQDIANIVARAIDYQGEWPMIGGIQGNMTTFKEIVELAEPIRGSKFDIDYVQMDDLKVGVLKSDKVTPIELPSIVDPVAFSNMATGCMLVSTAIGVWTPSDEWNKIFPDYKFQKLEPFLKQVWEGKP